MDSYILIGLNMYKQNDAIYFVVQSIPALAFGHSFKWFFVPVMCPDCYVHFCHLFVFEEAVYLFFDSVVTSQYHKNALSSSCVFSGPALETAILPRNSSLLLENDKNNPRFGY